MTTPIARRDALKSLGLSTAALFFGPAIARAQKPAAGAPPAPAAAAPAAAPAGPFTLPALGYADNALEPHIDARTMDIHRTKHQQAFVTNLNNLAKDHPDIAKRTPEDMIKNLAGIDEKIRGAIRNNAGGWVNHTMFWGQMKPGGGGDPTGKLADAIKAKFTDVAKFKEAFNDAGAKRFGSGWAWLVVNNKALEIVSTANQDNPLMGKAICGADGTPILGCDVWEHAYYLTYQNRRADYLKAWWNVVNWADVSARFDKAMA